MKALVTGTAGFIGSNLAESLTVDGWDVTGIDCFLDYYPRTVKERNLASLRESGRFRLIDSPLQVVDLGSLVGEVDVVYHLAAQAASSSSVYGDSAELPMQEEVPLHPVSPYGVSKLAAEMLCHLYFVNHEVPCISLRYFTVYGPRQRPDMAFHRLFRCALRGEEFPMFGDGKQTRDFTFVADAVAATRAASEKGRPGGVYNIGGGSRVSLLDVIGEAERIVGKSIPLHRESTQKGDMRDTFADTSRAQADFGYRPNVGLSEGLEAEWKWIRTLC
jgi:UDP-glucose 4-epimerase